MNDIVVFALLGLGAGGVYALLGCGLVLVYRGTGVINLAHGAMAMVCTYVFVYLRGNGELILPVPGLPRTVSLTGVDPITLAPQGLALLPSLAITLAFAAVLGALTYALVFQPLRKAPALAKIVGSVGWLAVLQAIVQSRYPDDSIPPLGEVLPQDGIQVLGRIVPADRLLLGLCGIVVAVALHFVGKRTRWGLATRASAQNEPAAALWGYSLRWLGYSTWILASVMAAVAGITIAPTVSINTVTFTLFIVPALVAALASSFRSYLITCAAGLVLGLVQSELTLLQLNVEAFRQPGLTQAAPFLLLVVLLLIRGTALPTRATLTDGRLPNAFSRRWQPVPPAVAVLAALAIALIGSAALRASLINTLVNAVLCLSVVVLTGYVGQISLAQLTLSGVAAFALFNFGTRADIPFPLAPLLAILVAIVVGVIVGVPALRVRGLLLAATTLAGAYAVENALLGNNALSGGLTGSKIADPALFGADFSVSKGGELYRPIFVIALLVVVVLLAAGVACLRRSRLGGQMLAVRGDEQAAAAVGISVTKVKVLALVISSGLAGMAGVLLAYSRGEISPGSFTTLLSILVIAYAYLGGITSVTGAFIGGVLMPGGMASWLWVWLGEKADWLSWLSTYELLLGGIALILTAITSPEGVAGAVSEAKDRLAPARRREAGLVVREHDAVGAGR